MQFYEPLSSLGNWYINFYCLKALRWLWSETSVDKTRISAVEIKWYCFQTREKLPCVSNTPEHHCIVLVSPKPNTPSHMGCHLWQRCVHEAQGTTQTVTDHSRWVNAWPGPPRSIKTWQLTKGLQTEQQAWGGFNSHIPSWLLEMPSFVTMNMLQRLVMRITLTFNFLLQ